MLYQRLVLHPIKRTRTIWVCILIAVLMFLLPGCTGTPRQVDQAANTDRQATDTPRPLLNGQIVFGSKRHGDVRLYIMSADGTDVTEVAQTERGINPEWSPDGQWIAFERVDLDAQGTPYSHIYVVHRDGTHQIRLTDKQRWDAYPTWSPDGQRIAFTPHGDIYVIKADGSNETQLTRGMSVNSLAWSPDGQRIAFSSFHEGQEALFVMQADGSHITRLTARDEWATAPAWSPDGQRLAFAAAGFNAKDIYISNFDGSQRRRVTTYRSSVDTNSTWPPNGQLVTRHSVVNTNPTWSPNGQQIAFISTRASSHGSLSKIYVQTIDSPEEIHLMDDVTIHSRLDWR